MRLSGKSCYHESQLWSISISSCLLSIRSQVSISPMLEQLSLPFCQKSITCKSLFMLCQSTKCHSVKWFSTKWRGPKKRKI